jgi:uroporphyrinogen decarboxylase
MTAMAMTSLERVLTTLGHKEPDRVPFFLLLTLHGAKELGLTIKDYFSRAEHVIEGQLRLRAKFHHDCYYPFFYAPLEIEAWGGEVIFCADGPPNSGRPFIDDPALIHRLHVPDVTATPCLKKVLTAIEGLKKQVQDDAPIIGVVMSPFSLPVMQMGFPAYLQLMYKQPDLFWKLMAINEEFCVSWAGAQLAAGATAICYFDPVSSPTIISRGDYLKTGHVIAKRTISRIHGPVVTHMASGRCVEIIDDIVATGTPAVGVSALESLTEIKQKCSGKISFFGNLNGIEMARWTPAQATKKVKTALAAAARGGGFILSDNHGEIPWQVRDDVLQAISTAVHEWGCYPLSAELSTQET